MNTASADPGFAGKPVLAAAVAELRTAISSSETHIMRAVIWSQVTGTAAIIVAIGLATLGFWLKG